MSSLLLEDLREDSLVKLETQATRHGFSLQKEVQAILEAATARSAQEETLRGWAREQPLHIDGDSDLDSVDQLERYMFGQETTLQERVEHFRPC